MNRILIAVAAVIVVVLLAGGGYYAYTKYTTNTATPAADSTAATAPDNDNADSAAADAAAAANINTDTTGLPSDTGVCKVAMARILDYGVVPYTATLDGSESGQADGQTVTCGAQDGQKKYTVMVKALCQDMSKQSCMELMTVKAPDGTLLYNHQG